MPDPICAVLASVMLATAAPDLGDDAYVVPAPTTGTETPAPLRTRRVRPDATSILDAQPDGSPSPATTAPPADTSALARQTQNPIADLISLPFQNNTYFGVGADDQTANVLNIQPVIPFRLSDDWNVITRTIVPVIYVPEHTVDLPNLPDSGDADSAFGIGDVNATAFFSPIADSPLTWGVGPAVSIPTATDSILGSGKLSLGPSAVVVYTRDRWVVGGLARHLWSVEGPSGRPEVNQTLIQPFVNYNLDDGWALSSAPIITANWSRDSDRWVVPVGGGFSKTFKAGDRPMQIGVQAYYNIEKPDLAPDWSLRIVVSLLFPK